jgi:hypothetical protein
MSTKDDIKTDPLLDNENQKTSGQEGKLAKSEGKSIKPASTTPAAQIKADAIAKFPNDTQTEYILKNSLHIDFIIQCAEGEKPGAYEEPEINGFKVKVPKGMMVNIPVQIANLLAEKYKVTMLAGQEKRIDRDNVVVEALS